MTLILTSDPTEVAANLPTILRDRQADLGDQTAGLASLASFVTSSQLVGSELLLTVTDPNRLGVCNQLNVAQYNGMVGAAIAGRVGFSFQNLRAVNAR